MNRLQAITVATFVFMTLLCLGVQTSSSDDGIVASYLGKSCVNDTDCQQDECCTPSYASGMRCQKRMTEGTICSSFTEELIKRLHRRCPCEPGTSCKNTGSVLGFYKVNKCIKDSS